MSSPYNFRPRCGREQRPTATETGDDSTSQPDTDSMAEEIPTARHPDRTGCVSSDASHGLDSSDVPDPMTQVRVPAPAVHRAMTAVSRAANITPTHSSTRSTESKISDLDIGRPGRPQIIPKRTVDNVHVTESDFNPLRRTAKRVASAQALKNANARAEWRFEKGLSPESEAEDESRTVSPVLEQELNALRPVRRTQIPSRLKVEGHDGDRLLSKSMPYLRDTSSQESDKENYASPTPRARVNSYLREQVRSQFQPRRRVDEVCHPQEVTEASRPRVPSNCNTVDYSGLGYGYGYHVPQNNEASFFIADFPADTQASTVGNSESDPPFATHPFLPPGAMAEYNESPGTACDKVSEAVDDDAWMAEFIDMSQFDG